MMKDNIPFNIYIIIQNKNNFNSACSKWEYMNYIPLPIPNLDKERELLGKVIVFWAPPTHVKWGVSSWFQENPWYAHKLLKVLLKHLKDILVETGRHLFDIVFILKYTQVYIHIHTYIQNNSIITDWGADLGHWY